MHSEQLFIYLIINLTQKKTRNGVFLFGYQITFKTVILSQRLAYFYYLSDVSLFVFLANVLSFFKLTLVSGCSVTVAPSGK